MKNETRECLLRIRVNATELEEIKSKANKTGKTVSKFVRECALGCKIKEKPDKKTYDTIINPLSDFIRRLSVLEKKVYYNKSYNESLLQNEMKEWQEYRSNIKERLW